MRYLIAVVLMLSAVAFAFAGCWSVSGNDSKATSCNPAPKTGEYFK